MNCQCTIYGIFVIYFDIIYNEVYSSYIATTYHLYSFQKHPPLKAILPKVWYQLCQGECTECTLRHTLNSKPSSSAAIKPPARCATAAQQRAQKTCPSILQPVQKWQTNKFWQGRGKKLKRCFEVKSERETRRGGREQRKKRGSRKTLLLPVFSAWSTPRYSAISTPSKRICWHAWEGGGGVVCIISLRRFYTHIIIYLSSYQ